MKRSSRWALFLIAALASSHNLHAQQNQERDEYGYELRQSGNTGTAGGKAGADSAANRNGPYSDRGKRANSYREACRQVRSSASENATMYSCGCSDGSYVRISSWQLGQAGICGGRFKGDGEQVAKRGSSHDGGTPGGYYTDCQRAGNACLYGYSERDKELQRYAAALDSEAASESNAIDRFTVWHGFHWHH